MSTLHIVANSPYRTDDLRRCLSLATPGDAILLIEDGVIGVNQPELENLPDIACFVLLPDLAARGLQLEYADMTSVDYAGFVDLVCQHRNSVTYA